MTDAAHKYRYIMKKYTVKFILVLILTNFLISGVVLAEVKALGYVLGKDTYKRIKSNTNGLKNIGINKYSHGKMLEGLGTNWNIQGLRNATLIFDENDKLSVLMLSMDKSYFDRVTGFLGNKYTLKSKKVPFVGNKSAIFSKDNITIKVNAPHMSFKMDVIYSTDVFEREFERISKLETNKKDKHEQSQF